MIANHRKGGDPTFSFRLPLARYCFAKSKRSILPFIHATRRNMALSTSTFQCWTPKFRGSFQGIPIDLTKIDRALADAVRQRAALIADRPETADLPLLVAIFPGPFVAEYLFAYPRSFAERSDDFRKVSGIFRQDASAISPCRRPSYPGLHRAPGKIRRTQAQRIIRLSLRR